MGTKRPAEPDTTIAVLLHDNLMISPLPILLAFTIFLVIRLAVTAVGLMAFLAMSSVPLAFVSGV